MIHNLPQMETINKTAKIINLPKYFVRQLVLQRKIKYVKACKKYLVNVDNLIEYLNTGDTELGVENIDNNKIKRVSI